MSCAHVRVNLMLDRKNICVYVYLIYGEPLQRASRSRKLLLPLCSLVSAFSLIPHFSSFALTKECHCLQNYNNNHCLVALVFGKRAI